jgi:hypothetical protein
MKYKTLFRLALRLVGILLIAESLPWLVVGCAALALDVFTGGVFAASSGFISWQFQNAVIHLLGGLTGLYLFFGGAWIVNRAIPSNRPYCPECGYEITGLPPEGLCPECGTAYRRPNQPSA